MRSPGATSHAGFEDASFDTFLGVLGRAIATLESHEVPYVVLGGIASAALGRPRFSSDVDLLVKPGDAPHALAALARAGFATERTNEHWIYKGFLHGVLVDVIFKAKGDIYLDDEMLARSTVGEFGGRRLRLIPPEDLLVIKALVHDEETPRHWYDALGLVAAGGLDWEYLIRRARKGSRRVLSLLLYATSIDLIVPPTVLTTLFAQIVDDPTIG